MNNSNFFYKTLLPKTYRRQDFFDYYNRDPYMVGEKLDGNIVEKGLIIEGIPSCLTISLHNDLVEANLDLDGEVKNFTDSAFKGLVEKILGLDQNIDDFESCIQDRLDVKTSLKKTKGLRIICTPTVFEAFTRSVFSQQISLNVAIKMRRKFIELVNISHSSGIMCYPAAQYVVKFSEKELKYIGCSLSKAVTIMDISKKIVDGELTFHTVGSHENLLELRDQLLAIKGVGPWTADSTLMRGYGYLDSCMHNDLAIRKKIQTILNLPIIPSPKETERYLKFFSPFRGLLANHMWAW